MASKKYTDLQFQAEGSQTTLHPPKIEMFFVSLFVKIIIFPRQVVASEVL